MLEQLGGSADGFAARQLTGRVAASADLILTMTRAHRDAVLELAPSKLNRTFTLVEAAYIASNADLETIADFAPLRAGAAALGADLDVPDPIGGSPDLFESIGEQIAALLPDVLDVCVRTRRQRYAT